MASILTTNGDVFAKTVAQFEAYDIIRQSAQTVTDPSVKLTIKDGGFLDISSELGATAATITASKLGNSIVTGSGNDTINGGVGKDELYGGKGNDSLFGGLGQDRLYGGDGLDTLFAGEGKEFNELYGDAGDDILVSGSNNTGISMDGGTGNDKFYLNFSPLASSSMAGRSQILGGDGIDTLFVDGIGIDISGATVKEVENLVLKGVGMTATSQQISSFASITSDLSSGLPAIKIVDSGPVDIEKALGSLGMNLKGSDLGNRITTGAGADNVTGGAGADTIATKGGHDFLLGGGGADILDGGDGNDQIFGEAGIDRLIGGAGNDRLDGGTGADDMRGGLGNDVYYVDTISTSTNEGAGDKVVELAGEGSDTVYANGTYTLGANIEGLVLTGTGAFTGTGTSGSNVITGNDAANTLNGLGGVDTMNGAGGNDRLVGGLGADVLTGGYGKDVFAYTSVSDSLLGSAADRIMDFTNADDKIDLRAIDANSLIQGDQAFKFDYDHSFSIGEIQQTFDGTNTLIEFNLDGDAAADMSILLINHDILAPDYFMM
jgi:Ca2+-binding RTX toxin-like protein